MSRLGSTFCRVRVDEFHPRLQSILQNPSKGSSMTILAASLHDASAPTPAQSSARGLPGKKAVWAGRVLSGLAVAFLAFDAGFKFMVTPEAVAATAELGWPADVLPVLGVLELVCLAVYLVPRTAILGAVLWTGYLGGAIATHLRVQNPLPSHTLFPIYIAVLLWGGLYLRDRRVRALHAAR
jgi:hypothetical protein